VASSDPAAWESYAVAFLGAAAVLVGLIFVGLSINLDRLLAAPWLFRRAGAAIVELVVVLVGCALLLVPDQPRIALSVELMALGFGSALLLAWLLLRDRDAVDPRYRRVTASAAAMGIGGLLLVTLAGLTLATDAPGGLYWLVPATLVCIIRAMLDSWVLLVEVNR
jgi:modulator of FtsH protease